jgi:leucyl/phenylalanyl-tRNA--protein transferase
MVLLPEKLRISKSLDRVIQKKKFEIKVDHGFPETMRACASVERPKQEATWIEEDMIRDYTELHSLGIAHSIEAFLDEERVGGLYGLALGKVFFGESMFSTVSDASKVCLAYLVELSQQAGVELIDCQVHTSHLESMGGEEIPRKQYLNSLKSLASSSKSVIDWTVFQ